MPSVDDFDKRYSLLGICFNLATEINCVQQRRTVHTGDRNLNEVRNQQLSAGSYSSSFTTSG